ncbi:ThiF family adenylyltransferase [Pseudonocardia sp. ICBG1293]|uniref:HesA/MoeB/ThiF family protein n=1 Tax=Pseudonocardia sp. ICBG1293 TaxID=2844382 RepID=UPI001CCB3269|nr:ThiF family adenylyltransferase [Pseudonocardia sp. ICBG1293]
MLKPRIKEFLRIYRLQGEDHLYIGIGPEKTRINNPTDTMVQFVLALDGSATVAELRKTYAETDTWLDALTSAGVLDDATTDSGFSPVDLMRWSRQINHLRLYDRDDWNGYDGMRRIRNARVVIIGTGAGGSTLLRLLNAAGFGTLEAVDFDTFAEENLPTHPTFDEEDVGELKLEALQRHLSLQSSYTNFIAHDATIRSADDLVKLVDGADFFFNAYDRPQNQAIRWSSEASLRTGVPFGQIGITNKGARVGPTMIPGRTPCMECVGIRDLEILRMEKSGSLTGTLVAMVAGIAVNEVIGLVSGAKTDSRTAGQSLYVNAETLTFEFTRFGFRDSCDCNPSRSAA